MNTEDERREEIQSAVARNSLRFDNELVSANGKRREHRQSHSLYLRLGTLIPYSSPEQFEYLSTELTPAESEPCHCFSCLKRARRERKKFTVRRMPGKIAHLVPMQRFDSIMVRRTLSLAKPSNPDYHPSTSNKSAHVVTASVEVKSASNDGHAPLLVGIQFLAFRTKVYIHQFIETIL